MLRVLRVGGRLLTCGATAGYDPAEDIRFIWTFELQVLGSNGWAREDIMALLEMVRLASCRRVVDETFPLERARRGARPHRRPQGVRQAGDHAMSDAAAEQGGAARIGWRIPPLSTSWALIVVSADAGKQEVVMRAPMRPEFERGAALGSVAWRADRRESSTRSAILRW